MKYFIILLSLLILPLTVKAASGLTINLFYSDNKLAFGNPAVNQNKGLYISSQEFEQQSANSSGEFTLLITNWRDQAMITNRFNAQLGGFSLTVPYYPTIKKLTIIKTSNQEVILEKDLGDISICNTNKVCEFEKGENAADCIPDCGVSHPKYSKQTAELLKTKNGIITDTAGKTLLKEVEKSQAGTWAIVTVVVIAGLVIAFIIIRRKRYGR